MEALATATVDMEVRALLDWAARAAVDHPVLWLAYVPSERYYRAGIPHVCLPVPKGMYGGLYVTFRAEPGKALSQEQNVWLARLQLCGHRVWACDDVEEAKAYILEYLEG